MMEDDFYATIKLKTGEEIFTKVMPTEENNNTLLLIVSPITITEFKSRTGMSGYKVEPWLKTTTEDLFVINMNDVLTMTENTDIEMIMAYQQFSRKMGNKKNNKPEISRQMGYLANVNDAKELLEKLYKSN
jgi:hypothetical protein